MIHQALMEDCPKNTEKVFHHQPVMMNEVIEHLNLQGDSIILDGTLGLGGHAQAVLEHLTTNGRLIGVDRDLQSLKKAQENLKSYSGQCEFVQDDFRHIPEILERIGIPKVDGILLDLGISSFQLDNIQRGFSLRTNGPLDMRMDQDSYISAYDLVNSLSEKEISAILKDFGQERWHYRIAHSLVHARVKNPIETTRELRHIVMRAIPYRRKRIKIHPATRTFQALRIAVNRELESLEMILKTYPEFLNKGGRMVVIAFHSLEDRLVKENFRNQDKEGKVKIITKKPLRPPFEETRKNPRSRSARLRVAERI